MKFFVSVDGPQWAEIIEEKNLFGTAVRFRIRFFWQKQRVKTLCFKIGTAVQTAKFQRLADIETSLNPDFVEVKLKWAILSVLTERMCTHTSTFYQVTYKFC